ncbi:MAG TPA: hypothetical protein VM163_01780 [bacterium]|nr:hypothetical protein [bacterium]
MKLRFLCLLTVLLLGLTSTASAAGHLGLTLSTDSVVMSDSLGLWGSLTWDGPDVFADLFLFVLDDYGDFGFLYPECTRPQPCPTQFMGNVFVPSGATVEYHYIGGFPVERFVLQEPFGRHQVGIAMTERGTLNIIAGPVFEDFEILPSPLVWRGSNDAYIRFEYDETEGVWALVEAGIGVRIDVQVLYSGHYSLYEKPFIRGYWRMGPNWRQSIESSLLQLGYDLVPYLWRFTMTVDVQPRGADMHVLMEHRNRWERGDGEAESWVGPIQAEHLPPH